MRIVSIEDISEKVDYGLTEKARDEKIGPKFLRITDIQNDKVNWDSVPYCKCNDKDFEKNKLEVGDIVFARTGATTGKSFLVKSLDYKAVYASYLIRLRLITDQVLPEFVSYFFKSVKYWNQIYTDSDGATLPSFNATKLKALKIPLPTLSEQKAIVAKLDRAQRLIDIDKAMLAKYDQLIQSVFLEMFGDPVTNEKRWDRKPMKEIGELKSGGTPSRTNKEFFTGDIDWYTTGELESMYLGEAEEKITESAIEKSSAKIFEKDSLLIGMYDTSAFKLGILTGPGSSNQASANIKLDDGICNVEWLYYCLKIIRPSILHERRGIRQKNLNLGFLKKLKIIMPPLEKQLQFTESLNRILTEKKIMELSSKKSQELFSSLVQEVFG
ncbi:MAG: restriction endonuclease subunit S [Balneola sp.]